MQFYIVTFEPRTPTLQFDPPIPSRDALQWSLKVYEEASEEVTKLKAQADAEWYRGEFNFGPVESVELVKPEQTRDLPGLNDLLHAGLK